MGFITGPRTDLIYEYTRLKKYKGKYVMPIGCQELKLSSAELTVSKKGSNMIVLTMRKAAEENDLGQKVSFHPIVSYYVESRLESLFTFVLSAFNLRVVSSSIHDVIREIKPLKGANFHAVILHKKRLMMSDGKPAERKYIRTTEEYGLPIIVYEPQLWKVDTKPIPLEVKNHKLLIQPFSAQDQELFNVTLLNRYKQQLELNEL